MPLVLTMMIAAVVKNEGCCLIGESWIFSSRNSPRTTMISALVGIGTSNLFGLSLDGLTEGARELSRADSLINRQESISNLGLADMLVRFILQIYFRFNWSKAHINHCSCNFWDSFWHSFTNGCQRE